MDGNFFIFFSICLLLTITPGADMALVTKNALSYPKKGGLITAYGICAGLLIYGLITSSGISYFLMQNKNLFNLVKTLGGLYLIYIGGSGFYSLLKTTKNSSENFASYKHIHVNKNLFFEGILTNLLNPKILIFYLSMLPQFIDIASASFIKVFSYTLVHIIMGLIWLCLYSLLLNRAGERIFFVKNRKYIEGLTSLVMIIFGLTVFI